MSSPSLRLLASEIGRGKSLVRTLQNERLQSLTLSGKIADLGGRDGESSYFRFMKLDQAEITCVDAHASKPGVVKADLEQELPLPESSFDHVLLFNILEHLYNHRLVLSESHRILKKGGRLHGVVPFLYKIHADPSDFFRFTEYALRNLLRDAGFPEPSIEALGFGPCSAGLQMIAPLAKAKPLVFGATVAGIAIDRLLNALLPNSPRTRSADFPLCYYFEAQRTAE